jgi:hypothetical protein
LEHILSDIGHRESTIGFFLFVDVIQILLAELSLGYLLAASSCVFDLRYGSVLFDGIGKRVKEILKCFHFVFCLI